MDNAGAPLEYDGFSLFEAIDHEEDLIAVLRGQIHVERRLNRLLALEIPKSDPLLSKLSFSQKVHAARDAGLINSEAKRALLWLGELRNRFAHEATVLTAVDAEVARKRLSAEGVLYVKEMLDFYKREPGDFRSIIRLAISQVWTEISYALEERGHEI